MTEPETQHLLVQAEVPPLDVDGLAAATVGTVLFAVAAGLLLTVLHPWLVAHDHRWWSGVALAGTVLGVIGVGYCHRVRRVRHRG